MTKLTVAVAVALLAGLLVLGTGACGSGGGGGEPGATPDAFFGDYWSSVFIGEDGTPDDGRSQWGRWIASGFGAVVQFLFTENENGVIAGPSQGSSITYTLAAGGRLSLVAGGVPFLAGGLASDGSAAAVAGVFAPFDPGIFLYCRRQGTFTTTSLAGLYHFVLFAYDFTATNDIARWGTMTFNNGVITVNRMNNVSGAVSTTIPFSANYFVAGDGQVDLTMSGETFRGGVLQGGDLAVLGGATANGGKPTILILVKGSTAASNATLSGTYHAVGIEAPVGGTPDWSSYTTTADADGSGGLTINAGQRNDDGVVSALAPMTFTYTVAADGTLSIAGGNVVGGVSPTGRYAIYAGSTVPAQAPLLWFLLR